MLGTGGVGRDVAYGINLRLKADLEAGLVALDLSPLPGLPLRNLDVGLGFQALDVGIGRGRLLGDLDLRLCSGDGRIG